MADLKHPSCISVFAKYCLIFVHISMLSSVDFSSTSPLGTSKRNNLQSILFPTSIRYTHPCSSFAAQFRIPLSALFSTTTTGLVNIWQSFPSILKDVYSRRFSDTVATLRGSTRLSGICRPTACSAIISHPSDGPPANI